jgi:hypothetical protein
MGALISKKRNTRIMAAADSRIEHPDAQCYTLVAANLMNYFNRNGL